MRNLKDLFVWSKVLTRAGAGRDVRLPERGAGGLRIEMMQRHALDAEYLSDLRVSARNGGVGLRRK
jgi:hypothetical protein